MKKNDPGKLYVVATPIGHLADFSARAVETLKSVHVILAEDTRHSYTLLQHFGIQTPMQSCHQHNEIEKSDLIITALQAGQSFALISDAGTPVFSDPGAKLIARTLAAGFRVIPIPGACAAIAALSVSGYEGLPFHFYGFLPTANVQKRKILTEIAQCVTGTLAFYEAPHRLIETLRAFQEIWGPHKEILLAKELTKLYESVNKNSIINILNWLGEDPKRSQGEFVLILENKMATADPDALTMSLDALLMGLMGHVKLKEAVTVTVQLTGLPKNQVYERALSLKASADSNSGFNAS